METPKVLGKYECGQLFLHRVFGYRGVILFPWLARIYDRDQYQVKGNPVDPDQLKTTSKIPLPPTPDVLEDTDGSAINEAARGKTHTFYQVLIDSRDCPYIVSTRILNYCETLENFRVICREPKLKR